VPARWMFRPGYSCSFSKVWAIKGDIQDSQSEQAVAADGAGMAAFLDVKSSLPAPLLSLVVGRLPLSKSGVFLLALA
jgi:hypothetical protein